MLAILGAAPTALGYTTIHGTVNESHTVVRQSWDAYKVVIPAGQKATVRIGASGAVDFYVFPQSQYGEYTNPSGTGFHTTEDSQNAIDFTYTTSSSDYIFVVDNAMISVSGASGNNDVSYSLQITYQSASLLDYSCYILVGLVIVAIAGTSYWLYTPPKAFHEASKQLRAQMR